MKLKSVALALLLFSSFAYASEYTIDLKLNNLKLRKFEYLPAIDEMAKIEFKYGNEVRSYFMYVPKSKRKEMSVVVALHGAGRSGSSMIDAWKKCSNKHGFMVIAPNGKGNSWDFAADDIAFIKEATKDALNKSGLKSTAKYLFGHSNGARRAIAFAALYPDEYKVVVAHAGTLPELSRSVITRRASVAPSIGLFLGDKDHIFSVESARLTATWFEKNGYPTSLYIMKNHSHWYYEDFDRINESVWAFMSKK